MGITLADAVDNQSVGTSFYSVKVYPPWLEIIFIAEWELLKGKLYQKDEEMVKDQELQCPWVPKRLYPPPVNFFGCIRFKNFILESIMFKNLPREINSAGSMDPAGEGPLQ